MTNNFFYRLVIRIYLLPYQLFSLVFLRKKKMTIITGADSKFFHSMMQLINSIIIHEKGNCRIVAYDLGLTNEQIGLFKWRNPTIELKKFDFLMLPPHANINENSGSYAWKPQIILEEFNKKNDDAFIFWLDSASIVRSQLLLVRAALYFYGFYSVIAGASIKELTHETTIVKLDLSKESGYGMLNAGMVGFNKKSDKNGALISEWAMAALDDQIISPAGSNKNNHRYDQSIVSMLFYKIYDVKNQPIISKKGLEIIFHKYIG